MTIDGSSTSNAGMAGALLGAALFAATKHRDQRRKDQAGSPYINHPLAVAEVLARHGVGHTVVLQAALLHDTIEDTETTADELEASFGPEVLEIVMQVTDDKSVAKSERKRRQIENASALTDRAKLVKIADKICNVVDVGSDPPDGWSSARRREYLDWTEAVVEGCRGVHPELEAHYDRVLSEGREQIDGPAPDTGTTVAWELWYRDTFDGDGDPSVDLSGSGLVEGLSELWARHLFETVGVAGSGGFSRFHLVAEGDRIEIAGSDEGAGNLRDWVFGQKRVVRNGYVAEADSALLGQLARTHAALLDQGRAVEEILSAAESTKVRSVFEEVLAGLA